MEILNPTMHFQVGDIARVPFKIDLGHKAELDILVEEAISIAREDYEADETSIGFAENILIRLSKPTALNVVGSIQLYEAKERSTRSRLKEIEELINRIVAEAYALERQVDIEVADDEITVERRSKIELVTCLLSYAIGCMMGRYSLDESGLIYANSGNVGFDPSRYPTFPADDDGIVPITSADWFDDDVANRFVEFLRVGWSAKTLTENLSFVADSLRPKANETPIDTIRRFFGADFFKGHLKTYKKRPIYWLFSSGKEKAFEALVYLHRYNEGTLSRMRMEYVIPLQGRIASRIDQLDRDIAAAATTAAQKKLRNEQVRLRKQQAELVKFDEELRHYADMRIKLDLDDGVKINYGKFGNLLAEVKAITGGSDE